MAVGALQGALPVSANERPNASANPLYVTITTSPLPITGDVNVTDRAARLLGIVYGNQAQLQQRAGTLEALVQVSHQGTEIDPRQIRALSSATDSVTAVLSGSGVDVTDRAARLLGIVYGDVGQLAQRASTRDALVQLRTAGTEYDARQIRALTSSDQVTIRGDTAVAEQGQVSSDAVTALSRGLRSQSFNYVYNGGSWDRMRGTTTDGVLANVSDRAARLLGIVYGDVGQLAQRASTRDALVQLRTAGTEYDARQIRALTSSDQIDVSDRSTRDLGRVYGSQGMVLQQQASTGALVTFPYGSWEQFLQQRAATYDLLVQLRTAGTEYDARQIRALTSSDVVTAYGSQAQALLQRAATFDLQVQLRNAGIEIDPRQIRALTVADVVQAVPARASERSGGTPVQIPFAAIAANATLYTVTAGKTLYIEGGYMTGYNTSTAAAGDVRIRHGAGGAERFPFLMPPASTGGVLGGTNVPSFSAAGFTPVGEASFTAGTAVRLEIVTGTVNVSGALWGYEV